MSSNNHPLVTMADTESFSQKYAVARIRLSSRLVVVCVAFLAICQRDFLVAWRELLAFLIQLLLQPLFFLFIFGSILPLIGAARPDYAASLLPGMVALTTLLAGCQSLMMSLTLDLGHAHEIEDRLLAPLSVHLVALEKVLFATLRGLIGGAMVFPLAVWMLGSGYQVRGDTLGLLFGLMVLTALTSASLGLAIGSAIQPKQLGLIFGIVFIPLIFTGCVFYPWVALYRAPWFMILTLFNPLTYASEGLRAAMVPPLHGTVLPTLPVVWVVIGQCVATAIFLVVGLRLFYRRVVS